MDEVKYLGSIQIQSKRQCTREVKKSVGIGWSGCYEYEG